MDKVIYIDNYDKFKGRRVTSGNKPDILKEQQEIFPDTYQFFDEIAASHESNQKEDLIMDQSIKGYIDDQLKSLEKSVNHRFDSQEKLLTEKLDHLHTKTEKSIYENFTNLKETIEKDRKEDRKFYITTAVGIAAVVVAILGFVF